MSLLEGTANDAAGVWINLVRTLHTAVLILHLLLVAMTGEQTTDTDREAAIAAGNRLTRLRNLIWSLQGQDALGPGASSVGSDGGALHRFAPAA